MKSSNLQLFVIEEVVRIGHTNCGQLCCPELSRGDKTNHGGLEVSLVHDYEPRGTGPQRQQKLTIKYCTRESYVTRIWKVGFDITFTNCVQDLWTIFPVDTQLRSKGRNSISRPKVSRILSSWVQADEMSRKCLTDTHKSSVNNVKWQITSTC